MIAIGIIGLILLAAILLTGIAQQLEQRTTRKAVERVERLLVEWRTRP